jgi:hypothetical protein
MPCSSFIKQQQEEPWCLVASFINPHDVYVAQHYDVEDAGYGPDDLNHIPMPLPHNCREDLSKPAKLRAHAGMTWHLDIANSMQRVRQLLFVPSHAGRRQILQVLEALHSTGQRDGMLIF